jgi:radical S-adenosyl methionine domain-containing protein 2
MKCKFCYATFDDMHVKQLPLSEAFLILENLKENGVQKVTFAGGEPLMYKYINEVISFCKKLGMTTSLITNGSLLTEDFLSRNKYVLDWIGISIDSLNQETNHKIGRYSTKPIDYHRLVKRINYDFKLKINTVVNRYNYSENMQDFINFAKPKRWKIFEALRVEGQNDKQFDEIKCSREQFQDFVKCHNHPNMVVEDNEVILGSYLLIDPQGRLFEDSKGKHTYSDPVQFSDFKKCLSQINLNRENFLKRGGIYKW